MKQSHFIPNLYRKNPIMTFLNMCLYAMAGFAQASTKVTDISRQQKVSGVGCSATLTFTQNDVIPHIDPAARSCFVFRTGSSSRNTDVLLVSQNSNGKIKQCGLNIDRPQPNAINFGQPRTKITSIEQGKVIKAKGRMCAIDFIKGGHTKISLKKKHLPGEHASVNKHGIVEIRRRTQTSFTDLDAEAVTLISHDCGGASSCGRG